MQGGAWSANFSVRSLRFPTHHTVVILAPSGSIFFDSAWGSSASGYYYEKGMLKWRERHSALLYRYSNNKTGVFDACITLALSSLNFSVINFQDLMKIQI